MKRILLICYVFNWALATGQVSVDSLRNLIVQDGLVDSSHLQALGALSLYYQDVKPDSARYFAERQYAYAVGRQAPGFQAEALLQLGNLRFQIGDDSAAMPYFVRSQRAYTALGDSVGLAGVLTRIGRVYFFQGRYEEALDFYTASLEIYERQQDQAGIAAALGELGIVSYQKGDFALARMHYVRSLTLFEQLQNQEGIARSLVNLGLIYFKQGAYAQALDYYRKSLLIQETIGMQDGMAACLNNIGMIYDLQGDNAQALDYYTRGLAASEKLGDRRTMATAFSNIGIIYKNQGAYTKALDHYARGFEIQEAEGDRDGMATTFSNMGNVYQVQGKYARALEFHKRGLDLFEALGNQEGMAISLLTIAVNYEYLGRKKELLTHARQAMKLATDIGDAELIKEAAQLLYKTYKAEGNAAQALAMYEQSIRMRDSLNSQENQRATIRYKYEKQALADSIEFAKASEIKDLQIAEQEARLGQQRLILLGVLIGLALIGALTYTIFRGKRRSDELLLNILPAETAAELKARGSAAAREYDEVSILFSDFADFTERSEQMEASRLVAELDACFKAFDQIIMDCGLEKIKTIGDAYMAAGGLPDPQSATAADVVRAGLAMQTFIEKRKISHQKVGLPYFEMRLGIHSGPVIAGVVGLKKFQYDVWGDTVNTASRMESNGVVGKVNISARTYDRLKDTSSFLFEERGEMTVKGKGLMKMYFVSTRA